MMKKNKNAWMESLEERIALTSSTIATGDMGGWVTRVNIVGRLGRHPGDDGVVDKALQDVVGGRLPSLVSFVLNLLLL